MLGLLTLFLGSSVFANIQARWFPLNQQVLLRFTDDGAGKLKELYSKMNTPPIETQFGIGKALETDDSYFTLVCSEKGDICQAVFVAHPTVQISKQKGTIVLNATQGEFAELAKLFVEPDSSGVIFETNRKEFQILKTKSSIRILFDERK